MNYESPDESPEICINDTEAYKKLEAENAKLKAELKNWQETAKELMGKL